MDTTFHFEELVAQYRATLPIVCNQTYLDSAGLAPVSTLVIDAIKDSLELRAQRGKIGIKSVMQSRMDQTRVHAASLLRADTDEIGLLHNTTEGINAIAHGFPFKPGDNVLLPENEFPANVYPWLAQEARGVEVRRFPVAEGGVLCAKTIGSLIDRRTRILSLSHVGYISGYRARLSELAELCHKHGIRLIVDAAQSIGIVDLDVHALGVDALTGCGWKWLLGPTGTSLLYLSRDMLSELKTVFVGAGSMNGGELRNAVDLGDIKGSAARYEFSTLDIAAICGLEVALSWILRLGTNRIENRVAHFVNRLTEELPRLGMTPYILGSPSLRAGIVSAKPKNISGQQLLERLYKRQIQCGHWHGYLRMSPHFFNSETELESLFVAIREEQSHFQ